MVPRASNSNNAFTYPATVSEMLIWPGGQCASINEAVFTASPQISKLKRRLPTTPEMTGPVWMPTRNCSAGNRIFSLRDLIRATNDDGTNIIVSQQRRDLVFGDWTSA